MAPGPPNLGDNRFAPLLTASPPSKKRNYKGLQFEFPELPVTKKDNPRYLLLTSLDNEKHLSAYSCFAVYKSLQAVDKNIISITSLRDGNLLLLVKSQFVADKFLALNSLPGICKIQCKLHNSLNFVKGTVYAPYLNDIADEDIIKELSSEKVVSVYKFNKTIDGKPKPTGVLLLTFDLYSLPQKIGIAWHQVKVREYIPNPMRCKQCQRLGHTAKYCKNPASCAVCSLPPHLPERPCTQIQCANCRQDHESSSRNCPQYLELKELLKIKINNKCSMRQARALYNPPKRTTTTLSYSSALNHTNNNISLHQNIRNSTNGKNYNNKTVTTTALLAQQTSTSNIETVTNTKNKEFKNNTTEKSTDDIETTEMITSSASHTQQTSTSNIATVTNTKNKEFKNNTTEKSTDDIEKTPLDYKPSTSGQNMKPANTTLTSTPDFEMCFE